MKKITVVGLGPGARGYLTLAALDEMKRAKTLILRTGKCDAALYLREQGIAFQTLDALYEQSEDFDALISACAAHVLDAAKTRDVVYAVLDAGGDETVRAIREKASVRFLCGVTLDAPLSLYAGEGAKVLSAQGLLAEEKDAPLLITELDSRLLAGEAKLKLLPLYGEEQRVLFFPPAGDALTREPVEIALCDLDRQKKYDHTCCACLCPASLEQKARYSFADLVRVMHILRGENGCPWDREQTHASLRQYLIEEAYETAAAIDDEDWPHAADELGDVLLQVVFQANIGDQYGTLSLSDITTAICKKMIARHPHIFGSAKAETAGEVLINWDELKKKERGFTTAAETLRDVSKGLPPLMRAEKVQKRAANVNFDFDGPLSALQKVHEEADEVREELEKHTDPTEELGDLLFSVVNTARLSGVECETALMRAVEKFISRFENAEKLASEEGKLLKDLTTNEIDVYWNRSKRRPMGRG